MMLAKETAVEKTIPPEEYGGSRMRKKRIAIALGHDALGTTLPEQQKAAGEAAKAIADLVQDDCEIVITH